MSSEGPRPTESFPHAAGGEGLKVLGEILGGVKGIILKERIDDITEEDLQTISKLKQGLDSLRVNGRLDNDKAELLDALFNIDILYKSKGHKLDKAVFDTDAIEAAKSDSYDRERSVLKKWADKYETYITQAF